MAGAEKSPGGNGQARCVRRLARAIRRANRAGAKRARAGAGAHAGYARKKGPAAWGSRTGGGADGMERNGTRGRKRYAGTEPQSFGGGMRNMTCHDTMLGVFREPPRLRRGWAPPPRAGNQAREPRRRKTRAGGRGRAGTIRAQKVSRRWRAPRPAAARTAWSGTERGGGTDMQERNRRASAAAWGT